MDNYLEYRIASFFDYWKKRYDFIADLQANSPKENRHEIEVLLWGSLDALSNLWAESLGGFGKNNKLGGKKRFDLFLSFYGGSAFQMVSLPSIWKRVENEEVFLDKQSKIRLPKEVCNFLKYIGRPELKNLDLKSWQFLFQRCSWEIVDDINIYDLSNTIIEKFPELKNNKQQLEYWLGDSRYGYIAYQDMRSSYIHYGKPGNNTLGLFPEFMLQTLLKCIEGFEVESRQQAIDPYPNYFDAIEVYYRLIIRKLITYKYQVDFPNDELKESINTTRTTLCRYLDMPKYKEYLQKNSEEFYLRELPLIIYEMNISQDHFSQKSPFKIEEILDSDWFPSI